MRASTGGVSSMPTYRACCTISDMCTISAKLDELCFLNYSQTCNSYNIRVLFAMDRCLLSKRRLIFILSAFLLNSEIIFNIRSIFLCATAVLTETLKKFSMPKFYLAPHKINENLIKVNEKIIAKNWWNLCKNTS